MPSHACCILTCHNNACCFQDKTYNHQNGPPGPSTSGSLPSAALPDNTDAASCAATCTTLAQAVPAALSRIKFDRVTQLAFDGMEVWLAAKRPASLSSIQLNNFSRIENPMALLQLPGCTALRQLDLQGLNVRLGDQGVLRECSNNLTKLCMSECAAADNRLPAAARYAELQAFQRIPAAAAAPGP